MISMGFKTILKGFKLILKGNKTVLQGSKMTLQGSKIVLSGVKTHAKKAVLGPTGLWEGLICSYLWRRASYGIYW